MVRVLEVRFESNDCLGGQFLDLPLDVAHVTPPLRQLLVDVSEQLLRRVVRHVHEGAIRLLELVRVLVEGVISEVHVKVAQVHAVRFLVVSLDTDRGRGSTASTLQIRK